MSKAHYIVPTGVLTTPIQARLGASGDAAGNLSTADEGKLVKQSGESAFALAAKGDLIEGIIHSVEVATSAGWTVGGVRTEDEMLFVTADGLEATPGTGALAVGDYVVVGTAVVKGTALTAYPRVCKATNQIGSTPADLAGAAYQAKYTTHAWRVVSLGQVGTGAPGTTIVIQSLN